MTTQPHKNTKKGYSLRVSKKVPQGGANLAYVYNEASTPERNIAFEDMTVAIPENGKRIDYEKEFMVYPQEDMLLRSLDGISDFPSKEILLTDEYSIGIQSHALYYKFRANGLFDARNSTVSIYKKGLEQDTDGQRFEELSIEERDELVYLGNNIKVLNRDGSLLSDDKHYKIKLIQEGTEGFIYAVEVYTDFIASEDESFLLSYKKWENKKNVDVTDILNVTPFFERVSKEEVDALDTEAEKMQKKYAIVSEQKGKFRVYAPAPTLVADELSRPSHKFSYQIQSRLRTKLSEKNPGELKVGYMFINETEFGANIYNLVSLGKKLFSSSNPYIPSYLTLFNPHSMDNNGGKTSVNYWLADINMPEDHYLDYDVLILSGYGRKDLSRYQARMQSFVTNGGRLIIDNNGAGESVLDFIVDGKQTFIRNITFSKTSNVSSPREYKEPTKSQRYFPLSNAPSLGVVSPILTFGSGETVSSWLPIVGHKDNNNALVYTKDGGGEILVSNMGLMQSILLGADEGLKLFANLFLWMGEEQYIVSPERKEFVFHRNNLFKKEYMDSTGNVVYYDDRSDEDATQLVAKKLLAPSIENLLRPYVPKAFKSATGDYSVQVNSNNLYPLTNKDFEEPNASGATSWTATTLGVFPGWNAILFSGSATFKHQTAVKKTGTYAVSIEGTNTQAFFEYDLGTVLAGTYKLEAYISTETVSGVGGRIGLYLPSGEVVVKSSAVTGSSNYRKVSISFTVTTSTAMKIRGGFIDGNGTGKVYIDSFKMNTVGAVKMNNVSSGKERLYAYATATKGQGIDFANAGFDTEDIVIHHPSVDGVLYIRPYVYEWNNQSAIYQKVYGEESKHLFSIKKDEGWVNLGIITAFLPPLKAGALWADPNEVYYECEVGSLVTDAFDSNYVNVNIYDPETGKSFYAKNGKIVVRHYDIYGEILEPRAILQIRTDYYTVQGTKKQFSLMAKDSGRIKVELPATDDSRERWYMRVHKGEFIKNDWTGTDWEEISKAGRLETFEERTIGNYEYQITDYEKQVFYPTHGVNDREEVAQYVDTKTIRLDRKPLVIHERIVDKEELESISSDRKIFQASLGKWNSKYPVSVYWDEKGDGVLVRLTSGFTIDYEAGIITFTTARAGFIRASYRQDNFKIVRRRYMNERITKEILTSSDKKTWSSKHENWLTSPTPILYRGNVSAENMILSNEYRVLHETGKVVFTTIQKERVFADYSYFIEEELEVEDIDIMAGLVRMKKEITFKDEIYARYLYEENYLEYKGYYDAEEKQFMHLDLNPGIGHTFTLRQIVNGETVIKEVETEKLMNKEIFLYMLPSRIQFNSKETIEENNLRHVFTEEEWNRIKQARPEAMLLARIQVREHTNIENTVVMDARSRGGGLKETITKKDIERRAGNIESFWDIGTFDGKAYYEKGSMVMQLPKEVLQKNGGQFTEEEIREKMKKYVAVGIYVIVEYI